MDNYEYEDCSFLKGAFYTIYGLAVVVEPLVAVGTDFLFVQSILVTVKRNADDATE